MQTIDRSKMTEAAIRRELSEAARKLQLLRDPATRAGGRPREVTPCPCCSEPFPVATMIRHLPKCPKQGTTLETYVTVKEWIAKRRAKKARAAAHQQRNASN